ncbi:AraC family transcriptional regulator [Streptomyces sp. CoH27]|uniref:AraC family transcriptional regulator n=1 Tax=Streptomyces sp. CoH27 TaxID=2875763 RepID=UPI0035A956F6
MSPGTPSTTSARHDEPHGRSIGRPVGPGLRQGSTIATMAHRWGVTSAAHFSWVFRAACGVSPCEWRDTRLIDAETAPFFLGPPFMRSSTSCVSGGILGSFPGNPLMQPLLGNK